MATKAFVQQLSGRLSATLVSFVTVAVSARYFGPDSYGLITAALAFAGLFAAFGDFGANAAITRRIAQGKSTLGSGMDVSFGLAVFYVVPLSLICAGCAFLVYGAEDGSIAWAVLALVPFIWFQCLGSSLTPIYQSVNKFRVYAVSELAAAIATLAGMGLVAASGVGIYGYVAAANVAAVVRFLLLFYGSRAYYPVRVAVNRRAWAVLIRESLPIGATGFIGVLYFRIDVLALSIFSTAGQVGLYSLAYRVVGVVSTLPGLLITSSFYRLSETASSDSEFRYESTKTVATMLRVVLPLSIGGITASSDVVALVGGSDYADAEMILALLLIAITMKSINTILGAILTAIHRQRVVLVNGVTSLLVNILLLWLLVPRHGATGAAFALIVSELIPTVFMIWTLSAYVDWWRCAKLLRTTTLSCAAMVLYLALRPELTSFLVLVSAGLVFAVCMVFSERDVRNFVFARMFALIKRRFALND